MPFISIVGGRAAQTRSAPDSGLALQREWVDDEPSTVHPDCTAYRVIKNNCRYISASRIVAGHRARPIGTRTSFSVARLRLISLRCGTVSCTFAAFTLQPRFVGPPPLPGWGGPWWTPNGRTIYLLPP